MSSVCSHRTTLLELFAAGNQDTIVVGRLKCDLWIPMKRKKTSVSERRYYEREFDSKFVCPLSPADVEGLVKSMLGNKLSTKQTPKGGVKVNKVSYLRAL